MKPESQMHGTGRDLRLDLFRGLANWAIFLDHIPNNVVAWITTRNYGFSDAADLFVFITGYTVALVYGRMLAARGFGAAAFSILARTWQLYIAHILLFVFYVVIVGYIAERYGHAHLLDEFNIRRLIAQPIEFLKHGFLLEFKPLNLDVLPLYIVLMVTFPPVLWLLRRAPHVALLVSFLLYLLARSLGWNLPSYPSGNWYFNPFAWQFLFVIGAWIVLGGETVVATALRSRAVFWSAIAVLLFGLAIALATRFGWDSSIPPSLTSLFLSNDKTNLPPYRIVHFLALAVIAAALIKRDAAGLKAPVWRPAIICGQQSLEVFCVGILLAFVGHFLIDLFSSSIVFQIVVSASGIAMMVAVAKFCAWTQVVKTRPAEQNRFIASQASD